jgi:hypothetical protein
MYVDRLDELVDAAFFERMSNRWREELNRSDARKRPIYIDEGVQLLELARNAESLFAKQEPRENSRLLNFLLNAPGRTARWLPPSDNHLIVRPRRALRRVRRQKRKT